MSQIDWMRDILDAAEARGWLVIQVDLRQGVVLEEPIATGVTLRLTGHAVDAEFIRSLPEARQPDQVRS